MLARHIVGGGTGSSKAALARCLIHSATSGGMLYSEVPFIHCVTRPRSHSSWSAKVAEVQPSTVMQLRSCVGSIAEANARRGRVETSYELFSLDDVRLTQPHARGVLARELKAGRLQGGADNGKGIVLFRPAGHARNPSGPLKGFYHAGRGSAAGTQLPSAPTQQVPGGGNQRCNTQHDCSIKDRKRALLKQHARPSVTMAESSAWESLSMWKAAIVALSFGWAGPVMAQSVYGGYGNQGGGYGSNHGNSYDGGYGTGSSPSAHLNQGYTRNDGGYVQPHMQTNPNNTQMDNYGTRGNVNPYTGAYGTRSPRY